MLRLARCSAISRETERVYDSASKRIEALSELLEAASPEAQLKRGYSIVRSAKDGGLITEASRLSKGEMVDMQFIDGSKQAKVQ